MPSGHRYEIDCGVRINHHSLHGHPIHLCFNIQRTFVEGRQHVIIGENDRFQLLASHSLTSFSRARLCRIEDHDLRQGFHSISPNGFGEAYIISQDFFILLQPFFDRLRGINQPYDIRMGFLVESFLQSVAPRSCLNSYRGRKRGIANEYHAYGPARHSC